MGTEAKTLIDRFWQLDQRPDKGPHFELQTGLGRKTGLDQRKKACVGKEPGPVGDVFPDKEVLILPYGVVDEIVPEFLFVCSTMLVDHHTIDR